MATRTKVACEFNEGNVSWQYDWDDVTLKILQFRCTNTTAQNSRGTLTSQSTGQTVTQLVGPNNPALPSPWAQNVPSAVADRFSLSVDSRGRLVGLTHNFEWPV